MKQSLMRITSFLIILSLLLAYLNNIFKFKYGDGIYDLTKFYELENDTVDVLILGSSHAFENFNTGTLWDEYGMSTYILAGSFQPMWNTYYYLKEALKTQKPKLIVLEGYCTMFSQEYIDDSRIIKNNYGLSWSVDKIESLKASSPKSRWREFFLEYTQYHTRYKELSREDFIVNQGNPFYDDWKGFGCNMVTTPLECTDISDVTDRKDLSDKTERYYRETIELAKENNIPIIVVVSPYAGITSEEQAMFNRACDIATELGAPFVNCNTLVDDIGINYSVDAADEAHLNYRGNQKFSEYIGKYLKELYEIPDRRGEEKYASWDRNANYISQMIYDQELVDTTDINAICEKIQNNRYWIFVSIDGTCNVLEPNLNKFLSTMGIGEDATGIYFLDDGNNIWCTGEGEKELYRSTDAHDFHLSRVNNDGTYTNSVIIDNIEYTKVLNGINVVVYDTLTEKIVDNFGLNADECYSLVR